MALEAGLDQRGDFVRRDVAAGKVVPIDSLQDLLSDICRRGSGTGIGIHFCAWDTAGGKSHGPLAGGSRVRGVEIKERVCLSISSRNSHQSRRGSFDQS